MNNPYRTVAILLIVALFIIGSFPATGEAFPGAMHWAVHFCYYALITFTLGLGWQKMQVTHIALIVAGIGVVHELTEIITHSHRFETEDAIVNAIGALTGAVALYTIRKLRQSVRNS